MAEAPPSRSNWFALIRVIRAIRGFSKKFHLFLKRSGFFSFVRG
jgi:hypothetical protein